jgi:isochorismate synthase EntC
MAQATAFTKTTFDEFLANGWLVSDGPDHLIVGWGDLKEEVQPRADCASLFAPDFYLQNQRPWLLTPHWSIVTRDIFASLVIAKLSLEVNKDLQGFQWVEPDFEAFKRQFEAIREARKSRGLVKAVPVVHAQAREIMDQARLLSILNKLAVLPKSLSAYGFWISDSSQKKLRSGLIGATPELLFAEADGLLTTVALAGTRSKNAVGDGATKLLSDPKERFEHQLVVDDIRKVLSPFGELRIGETYAQELPTLFHLKTDITVKLNRASDLATLATSLHPTPALGVSPRALGFTEIKNWDDVSRRGRFGAPFGVALPGSLGSRCFVAIRGIQWQDDAILLGSGCGIVNDSELEREWRELELKRESVKRILEI